MEDGIHGRMTQWCAWLLVVALHAVFYWLLTFSPAPAPGAGREERRTRLVLATMTKIAKPPPSPAPHSARQAPKAKRVPPVAAQQPVAAVPAVVAPTSTAEPPRVQYPSWDSSPSNPRPYPIAASDFSPDPLRNRPVRLPGGSRGDRFKMAPSISPAKKVVSAIGQLLGGAGYATDPCVRIQENIAGLLADTSESGREQLQEELRRDRRHCQP